MCSLLHLSRCRIPSASHTHSPGRRPRLLSHTEQKWLPAYYAPQDNATATACASKVVDTTGAGNAFLGALTVSLLMGLDDTIFAACAGNVAASFVVEHVGVPTLSSSEAGTELWNSAEVSTRFQAYRARLDGGWS